jgi:hypothetical protein
MDPLREAGHFFNTSLRDFLGEKAASKETPKQLFNVILFVLFWPRRLERSLSLISLAPLARRDGQFPLKIGQPNDMQCLGD